MNDWQIVRHRVAIAGRVLEAGTEKAVADAVVSMTTMPAAFAKKLAIASLAYGSRWDALPERLESLPSDPWADFFKVRQSITAAMKKAVGMR